MRLDVELSPNVVTFDPVGSAGAYPLLAAVGTLRTSMRVGDPGSAPVTPSLVVSLDNSQNLAASILGQPLRKRATLYLDDDSVFFDGTISLMGFGRTVDLTIES